MKVKAWNMTSNSNKPVVNQIVIEVGCHRYFQSYDTVIAYVDNETHTTFLDEHYWDYSPTTSRYRNKFLGLTTPEIKAKIQSGEIQLADLN